MTQCWSPLMSTPIRRTWRTQLCILTSYTTHAKYIYIYIYTHTHTYTHTWVSQRNWLLLPSFASSPWVWQGLWFLRKLLLSMHWFVAHEYLCLTCVGIINTKRREDLFFGCVQRHQWSWFSGEICLILAIRIHQIHICFEMPPSHIVLVKYQNGRNF